MKVLFICKGNMFRSQMACAIYNNLTSSTDAVSAGTYTGALDEPEGQLLNDLFFEDTSFLDLMEEQGMYLRNNRTRKLLPHMIDEAEIVVSMAEEPFIPDFVKNNERIISWDIDNPSTVDRNTAERIYSQINQLVQKLISEI